MAIQNVLIVAVVLFAALAAPQISQPGPFVQASQTDVVPRTRIQVDSGRRGRMIVPPAAAGILQAEIIIR